MMYDTPYRGNVFRDGAEEGIFDVDYIALLAVVSVALEVYALQSSDRQQKDLTYTLQSLDHIMEKQEKLDSRLNRIERLLERRLTR